MDIFLYTICIYCTYCMWCSIDIIVWIWVVMHRTKGKRCKLIPSCARWRWCADDSSHGDLTFFFCSYFHLLLLSSLSFFLYLYLALSLFHSTWFVNCFLFSTTFQTSHVILLLLLLLPYWATTWRHASVAVQFKANSLAS